MEQIMRLLREAGSEYYGEEAVTQLQHALQSAHLAEKEGAPPALVVAALLHDIGHLLEGGDGRAARQGIDAKHEDGGSAFLRRWFDADVIEPVRLHVRAKAYLVATEPGYFETLSPASVRSLELQGRMSPEEAEAFRNSPHAEAAIALRRWDDEAKDPEAITPDVAHYLPLMESVARPTNG